MGLADELVKLEELRRSGALSDAEFTQAKTTLLNPTPAVSELQFGAHLADQLAEVKYQNELAQIDRAWEIGRRQYLIRGRYGIEHEPTTGMAVGAALVGIFGVLWTIMAGSIMAGAPDFGPFAVAKVIFPLFGIAFAAAAIGYGMYIFFRAQKYQEAFAAYQALRASVKSDHIEAAGRSRKHGASSHNIKPA